jgi:hypothetical protein
LRVENGARRPVVAGGGVVKAGRTRTLEDILEEQRKVSGLTRYAGGF